MRYSDINERYLYYVNFDPVQPCEFDSNHLVVVLKKNNDKKTAIVMPLTSRSNGVGQNKILLPTINSLPYRLKGDNSYAVYDQVRSVNYSRFEPIFKDRNGKDIIDVKIDDDVFSLLIEKGTEELEKKLSLDEILSLMSKKLNKAKNEKIINLAYSIKKSNGDKEIIESIEKEIKSIIYSEPKSIFYFQRKRR